MYRCSECGTEYEIKPDYCDCGNDTFIEVPDTTNPKPEKTNEFKTEIPKITLTAKNTTEIPKSYDIVSLSVFIFFVIISVFTAFYPVKDEETPIQKTQNAKPEHTLQNIPPVDSFWDDTPVKLTEEAPQNVKPEEEKDPLAIKLEQWLNKPKVVVEEPQIQIPKPQPKTIQKIQPVQSVKPQQPTPQQTSQPVQKPVQKQTSDTSSKDLIARVQKNAQNTVSSQSTQQKAVTIAAAQPTQHTPVQAQTIKVQNTQPAATQQTSQPKPQLRQYEQVKSKAELAQEVSVYKAALRNNIGRKINFANVVGDGNCSVTFKLDSSGKLLNRNFAVQSPNITLNDAVFSAMKSTTSFNPPPEGYKGETFTLRVNIYNGNFEITLN